MERIAIIGMGVSGATVLDEYAKVFNRRPHPNYTIDCYDSTESFGRGMPYREDSDVAILNSPKNEISFDHTQLEDFQNWLTAHHPTQATYVPRAYYGEYLKDTTRQLIESIDANAYYTLIESIQWLPEPRKWRIIPTNKKQAPSEEVLYDRIHLCCGEFPSHDMYNLSGNEQYVSEVYPLIDIPQAIQGTTSVGIIGTGLSAVDVIKYLLNERQVKLIVPFSRSGYFPSVRGKVPDDFTIRHLTQAQIKADIKANQGQYTVEQFEITFYRELAAHGLNYDDYVSNYFLAGREGIEKATKHPELVSKMQHIMTQVADVMVLGWEAMDKYNRHTFKDKYNKILDMTRNPMPPASAKVILEGFEKGRIKTIQGVQNIVPVPDSNSFKLVESNDHNYQEVDWVINATGMDYALKEESSRRTLAGHAVNKRVAQLDDAGGLTLNRRAITLISPRYGEWANLHGHGMLVKGSIYKNSMRKIRQHAHQLIPRLLSDYL